MTGPSILHMRAERAREAIEGLRARIGDEHARAVAAAATMAMQIRTLHATAHRKSLSEHDRETVLCLGFDAMAENLILLMAAAKIDQGDVFMLLPLLMKDMEDAASEMQTKRAAEGGGLH